MAETTVPLPTSSTQPESAPDPHVAWWAEAERLRERIESSDSDEDALISELNALSDRIAETPARTPEGIAVQVDLAILCDEEGSTLGPCEVLALRNAHAALERLAGGARP